MNRVSTFLIALSAIILFGCPEKSEDPKPATDRTPLLDVISVKFTNDAKVATPGFTIPTCNTPTTFQNVKFSVVDDIPGDQYPCETTTDGGTSLGIAIGNALLIDVSHYSGFSQIRLGFTTGCDKNIFVSLIDENNNVISEKVFSYGDREAVFSKYNENLEKLKYIKFTKACEGWINNVSIQ